MLFSGSTKFTSAHSGEAGLDPNALATAEMTLDDFATLTEYAWSFKVREGLEHSSAIRQSTVTIMMAPEERDAFEAYRKHVVRNNAKDAIDVLRDGGQDLMNSNSGCWKAAGALVGIWVLLIVLPYVSFFALCVGQALIDEYFNLGAALAAAYLP